MADVHDASEAVDEAELAIEGALRPASLDEFVGQTHLLTARTRSDVHRERARRQRREQLLVGAVVAERHDQRVIARREDRTQQ